jgi:hypothetical protein
MWRGAGAGCVDSSAITEWQYSRRTASAVTAMKEPCRIAESYGFEILIPQSSHSESAA